MNRYSLRLAWVGLLIGLLTLSAAAIADLSDRERRALETGPGSPPAVTEAAVTDFAATEEAAAEAFAPAPDSGRVLCFAGAGPVPACELRDLQGNSYGALVPDGNREADLGSLPPGRYLLAQGEGSAGSFRVSETGELTEAGGRLWTDGTRLWLEDFRPGAAEVRVSVSEPGYYSFQLVDDLGRRWTRDVFVSDRAPRDPDGGYSRTLRYDGLPEGRYTLVEAGAPLTQFQVLADGTAMIRVNGGDGN